MLAAPLMAPVKLANNAVGQDARNKNQISPMQEYPTSQCIDGLEPV
jgi:hypothetical protein